MEVGQTTSRSLASGHRPPGHALRGSGTDAHPAGSTLGALRPPVAAGQVLRSDCRARAMARICCEVTYRNAPFPCRFVPSCNVVGGWARVLLMDAEALSVCGEELGELRHYGAGLRGTAALPTGCMLLRL